MPTYVQVTTELMKLYNCRPGVFKYSDVLEEGVSWADPLGYAHGTGQVMTLFETHAMTWRPDTPDPDAPGMATEYFVVNAEAPSATSAGQPDQGRSGNSTAPRASSASKGLEEIISLTKRYVRVAQGNEADQADNRTGPLRPGNIRAHPSFFLVSRTIHVQLCAQHHRVIGVKEEWEGAAGWRDGSEQLPVWAVEWAQARAAAGLHLHPWIQRAVHAAGAERPAART